MSKPRILFSVPTRHHVEIAIDEVEGMKDLGYECAQFHYAAKEGVSSTMGRIRVIVQNALNLVKTARVFQPDIIYFNSRVEVIALTRDYITLTIFKSLYRKPVRLVLKSHGSELEVLQHNRFFMGKIVVPFLKKRISGWLFLSSEELEKINQSGYLDPQKVFLTKNIVRTEQFKPDENFRQKLNIPAHHKILLFVGRLITEKGIYDVVEAFIKLGNNAKATLVIVGNGPEDNGVKQMIDASAVKNNIITTGFIPEKEVVPFYSNADVLIFPTYCSEGFPMALFNSVSAGMAILTTPIRAAVDYLKEPENCLWVQPKNPDSIYQALTTLLQSDSLMAEMTQSNILSKQRFGKQQVCIELAKTLNQIMNQ